MVAAVFGVIWRSTFAPAARLLVCVLPAPPLRTLLPAWMFTWMGDGASTRNWTESSPPVSFVNVHRSTRSSGETVPQHSGLTSGLPVVSFGSTSRGPLQAKPDVPLDDEELDELDVAVASSSSPTPPVLELDVDPLVDEAALPSFGEAFLGPLPLLMSSSGSISVHAAKTAVTRTPNRVARDELTFRL